MMQESVLTAQSLAVWVNGTLQPGSEAKISVFDRGLLYGDGVYEGLRVIDSRKIFHLRGHLSRLFDSARAISLKIPYTVDDLIRGIADVVRHAGIAEGHVRVIVTRGPAEPGLDPRLATSPTVIIMAYPFSAWLRPERADGLTTTLSSIRRLSPQSLDPKIKNLNYLNEILAQLEAQAAGSDTALLFDEDGYLAEASAANVFVVRNGAIFTPYTHHCLAGITRATLIELAQSQGFACTERNLTYAELFTADEIFVTSTAVDVTPLIAINKRPIGTGKAGPVTSQLKAVFMQRLRDDSDVLF